MNHSVKTGFSFGFTSAIITTLGLMVGLNAGTHSRLVVLGGILTIAIADAFSDALGIHISEESEDRHKPKEIWISTGSTFLAKLSFALTFLVPVLLLDLETAVLANIGWGMLSLGVLSFIMARKQKQKEWKVVGEHLLIGVAVVLITNYVGGLIAGIFA